MANVKLPFSGFYETSHDFLLDNVLEYRVFDEQENPMPQDTHTAVSWEDMFVGYSKLYVKKLTEFTGIKMKFDRFNSPKEYNFETDHIYVEVDDTKLKELYASTDKDWLEDTIRERFTSRDGFISHYPNTLRAWLTPDENDPDADPLDSWDEIMWELILEYHITNCEDIPENDPWDFEMDDELYMLYDGNIDWDKIDELKLAEV